MDAAQDIESTWTLSRRSMRCFVRLGGFLLVRPNNRQEMRLQPKRRSAITITPLVGCAKRTTDCPSDLARCPFLECVFKHDATIKEKCPVGKKNLDKLPNGHYSGGEMKTKQYFVQVQGTEVWVRLLKTDLDQLIKAGHRLHYDEATWDAIYITVER